MTPSEFQSVLTARIGRFLMGENGYYLTDNDQFLGGLEHAIAI